MHDDSRRRPFSSTSSDLLWGLTTACKFDVAERFRFGAPNDRLLAQATTSPAHRPLHARGTSQLTRFLQYTTQAYGELTAIHLERQDEFPALGQLTRAEIVAYLQVVSETVWIVESCELVRIASIYIHLKSPKPINCCSNILAKPPIILGKWLGYPNPNPNIGSSPGAPPNALAGGRAGGDTWGNHRHISHVADSQAARREPATYTLKYCYAGSVTSWAFDFMRR